MLPTAFPRLSTSSLVQKIFAISFEVDEKPNRCIKLLGPTFWEERSRLFYGRL